ncbi:MAG: PH domain-containing protein [Woeseiaceae bacterium]
MSKNKEKRWRHTSPLAAIFYLGKIYKAIAQNAVQTFAPLFALLVATQGNLVGKVALGTVGFVTITVVSAIVRYWFFRYRITDDSVLIREGVFNKTQLDIKFDRIQAINTQQNIIFRQFDLVTIQFDTAGSSKQEGNLPAIKSELAESLKARIRTERRQETIDEDGNAEPLTDSRMLLRLDNLDMVRIGLSSGRVLIVLALLGPLMDNIDKRVEQFISESDIVAILNNAGISVASGAGLVISVIFLLLVLLAGAAIAGAFLRYYNFDLRAEEDTLRSTGGLLTRHEHSINLAKIQSLRAIQNPVLRIFRRYRLRAKQASSGKPGKGKQFVVPICDAEQLPTLSNEVFGTEFDGVELEPRSSSFQPIAKHYIRSRFLAFGFLPAVIVTSLFYVLIGKFALVFLIWLPISALAVWHHYRKFGFAIADNGVVLRRGFIGYQTVAFLHRKVQRINVTQTPLQERKGLATIRFYLASGSLRLPYVDHEMAKRLRDYILYKVESSQLAWH